MSDLFNSDKQVGESHGGDHSPPNGSRWDLVKAEVIESAQHGSAKLPQSRSVDQTPVVADLISSVESPLADSMCAEPRSATADLVPAEVVKPNSFIRRSLHGFGWLTWTLFCFGSLIALLAVLSAVPVLQLIAFGYLLDIAGRLAAGAKLRDSLPNLRRAGMIGLAVCAVFLASLPTQLLVHWESVAQLINPDSAQAVVLRVVAVASSMFVMIYLLWAWVRGGRLRHYFWPQPVRFIKESWRWNTWARVPDQLWEFTVALELPRLFWLGARGALGTLVWLIPGMIIISMNRNGETGAAGLVGGIALIAMGVVLFYLPMLQANFAAENKLSALFDVRRIRKDFRRAPWAWLLAMVFGLVLLPIPLYLLKIEATPREVAWLPCLVFVAFILPARVIEGLALRRARNRPEPSGKWAWFSIGAVRLLMVGVVATYLTFVVISQFTSWDGLPTWVEQHAILFPRPFIGGV